MFPRSERQPVGELLAPFAESIADVLTDLGDTDSAAQILSIASRHRISDGVALRRAEHAFKRGDASTALDALIPAWEAGSLETHLEVQMGLASLALGLYDVVETLTAEDDLELSHAVLRWFVCLWDDLPRPPLDFDEPQVVWEVKAQLHTLVRCGRTDIVHLVVEEADSRGHSRLLESIRGLPSRTPSTGQPCSPPLSGREDFRASWLAPAADAAFSWAWSSARQALEGERVLLLAPHVDALKPLLNHACLTARELDCESSTEYFDDQVMLDGTQYEHIIVFFEPNLSLDPRDLVARYARSLCHGGQMHLMMAGPEIGHNFDAVLSRRAIEHIIESEQLVLLGADSRSGDGAPTQSESCAVHVFRAEKRVV